jgi:hypothetical protein
MLNNHKNRNYYIIEKPICYIFIFIFVIFCSCKKTNKKSHAKKVVTEWTGKEIKFSNEINCLKIDSLATCPEISNKKYKILLYVDSFGCTSCRLHLSEWKMLISASDTLFSKKLDFIFVFQPKHGGDKEIKRLMKQSGFIYPVFLDIDNKTFTLNNFPKEQEYQCFLLDKDNKVVMVGNPVLNPAIWELYKKIILNSEE